MPVTSFRRHKWLLCMYAHPSDCLTLFKAQAHGIGVCATALPYRRQCNAYVMQTVCDVASSYAAILSMWLSMATGSNSEGLKVSTTCTHLTVLL